MERKREKEIEIDRERYRQIRGPHLLRGEKNEIKTCS